MCGKEYSDTGNMNSTYDYNADNIKVLEGLEAVRKRPAMYIGSTGVRGLHHLVYEVVDNSIDEALAGYCTKIDTYLHVDNRITIEDNGRGIPVDFHKKEGKPAAEVVMTTLHSGGKFDNESYKVSGGLHGVGISVVNALSESLEVEIRRDGKVYHQQYERGNPCKPLEVVGKTKRTGTKITFKPDDEIFESVDFSFDTLSQRFRELSFLNKGILIIFQDPNEEVNHLIMMRSNTPQNNHSHLSNVIILTGFDKRKQMRKELLYLLRTSFSSRSKNPSYCPRIKPFIFKILD